MQKAADFIERFLKCGAVCGCVLKAQACEVVRVQTDFGGGVCRLNNEVTFSFGNDEIVYGKEVFYCAEGVPGEAARDDRKLGRIGEDDIGCFALVWLCLVKGFGQEDDEVVERAVATNDFDECFLV